MVDEDIYLKNDTDVKIGFNIKKIRKNKGLKPSELVREVNLKGVSLTIFSLSKIEANTQHIKVSQLRVIKNILGCTYEELIDE